MDAKWPLPSAAASAVIVAGVQTALAPPPEWLDEYNAAALQGIRLGEIAGDPVIVASLRRNNEGNLAHWASCNLVAPGARVSVRTDGDNVELVREMVRRGLDSGLLDAFRTAQSVAWRLWMEVCFSLTDDVEVLQEVLDLTSRSIGVFIDDTVAALAEEIVVARAQLAGDTHAQRRAAVALILEGAPIADARAEAQLRYRLAGPHTAVVLSASGASVNRLEAACDSIMAANRLTGRLRVLAGADRLWVWFPTDALRVAVRDIPEAMRVVVGGVGHGREGFRSSHFQALAAERTLIRLGSSRTVVRSEELALIGAMSDDPRVVGEFTAQTLGELAQADPEVRECMRVWFTEQCNSTATAARLYTHRNTVVRRLTRAAELLPAPLSTNAAAVAAALEVLHWQV